MVKIAFIDVLITILFNILPVGLVWIPIIFLGKKPVFKIIYSRIAIGITFFFVVYFIMPVIFQIGEIPTNVNNDVLGGQDPGIDVGVAYLFARLFNVITNYLQLPLINQTFIFLLAPFISILYLFTRLRKEDKSKFKLQLAQLSFEYNKSPKELIIEKLTKGNLHEERRLFRALLVLLPITLYLLVTILKIAGVAALDPTDGGLGWFIEIFFIYIATFLYAIQLIKASKASFQGKFIGEKMENDTYSSLMSVATPISILSVLLFVVEAFQGSSNVVEAFQSLSLVIYFFVYYIMAAFIFVSMVAIFEPIAIVILIKIINRIKHKERSKKDKKSKTPNISQSFLFGLLSALAIFIFAFLVLGFLQGAISGRSNVNLIDQNLLGATFEPFNAFLPVLLFEGLSASNALGVLIVVIGVGMIVGLSYGRNKNLLVNSIIILAFLIVEGVLFQLITLIPGVEGNIFPFFGDPNDTYWVTSEIVTTDVFGFSYLPRTALVRPDLLESNIILYALSIPFQYTRYFFAFILIGLSFHYIRQDFITKTVKREKFVDSITFAQIDFLPTYEECQQENYLLSIPKSYRPSEDERDEVKRLMYECRNGITVRELLPDDIGERDRMYVTLKYMSKRKHLIWWEPEFSFTNERAELDSMYTMYEDGRDVFSYKFKESSTADPGLVAGMFSAITSFIKETTKSADLLRTIDHGDTKVIIEYGQYVFGAIFADRETVDIRSKLKAFVSEFERRHSDVLKKWDGNCTPFNNDELLFREIFEL